MRKTMKQPNTGKTKGAAKAEPAISTTSGSTRLEKEFAQFATAKGWDMDRKLAVLAELSYPSAWEDMVQEVAHCAEHVVGQLHEYFSREPHYFWRLLNKLIDVPKPHNLKAGDLALLDAAINQLAELKRSASDKGASQC